MSAAHKKLAKNVDAMMDNLEKAALSILRGKWSTYNTITSLQNENMAMEEEFHKKNLEMDEIEKEVRRKNLVVSDMVEELNEN